MPHDAAPRTLDPDCLYVIPLGIGNAFTSRYYHSSLLLCAGGARIMVDCPTPLNRVLRDATQKSRVSCGLGDIDHLLLTHLHGDHCNGVEEFAFYRRFLANGHGRPNLYLLQELVGDLWEHRLRAAMGALQMPGQDHALPQSLDDYFQVHGWTPGTTYHLAGAGAPPVDIRIRRTQHFVPCFGLTLRFGKFQVGYSCDTAFDPGHIDFLASSDLILHECGPGAGHTQLEQLMTLPEELRAKMLLIHIPDDKDILHAPIPVAREGAVYEVGRGREALA